MKTAAAMRTTAVATTRYMRGVSWAAECVHNSYALWMTSLCPVDQPYHYEDSDDEGGEEPPCGRAGQPLVRTRSYQVRQWATSTVVSVDDDFSS
jgi:hypothetical protein